MLEWIRGAKENSWLGFEDGTLLYRVYNEGATVTIEALVNAGLVKKALDGVKVLGNGELSKKLTVQVNAYSDAAKQKIEAAGGKAEVI